MSKMGCTGPDCNYEGTRYDSKAKKGVCTDTAGYISNAELSMIKNLNPNVKTWHDGGSNSDIMVYDGKFSFMIFLALADLIRH
jgi:hypothetical protein